jgi:predicted dehydrogenase
VIGSQGATAPEGTPGAVPDVGPRFPDDRSGVAILGCGGIAQSAHLPAYERYGVGVTGVWSRTRARTASVPERFPLVGQVYDTAEDLLADPDVRIVDIATGPDVRLHWVEAAVEAGKHVLAQKPLTLDASELVSYQRLVSLADDRGLRIAVNHNARWAPPWRMTTLLLREGAIGEIVGVTHLHDKPLPPLAGTAYDDVPHMLIADYLVHWLDITRFWLAGGDAGDAGDACRVAAVDGRAPGQPADAQNPWSAMVTLFSRGGAAATVRIIGQAVASEPGCPFWVHGTAGTLRGSVLLGSDRLTLDRGDGITLLPLGAWFVDGFAAAMGELMCAIAEDRDPENSLDDSLATARLVLAARESAERSGVPVPISASA